MREGTSETGVHRAPEVGAPASVRRPVTWTMCDSVRRGRNNAGKQDGYKRALPQVEVGSRTLPPFVKDDAYGGQQGAGEHCRCCSCGRDDAMGEHGANDGLHSEGGEAKLYCEYS